MSPSVQFGVNVNTRLPVIFPRDYSLDQLLDLAVQVEDLGYESVWVWDHILLGVDPYFPILDSLSVLTAVAARTETIRLGTGILVLPARNPVVLAKQLSSIDQISNGRLTLGMASGWYKREFDAIGVPFNKRGNVMDQNLEILTRLWQEDSVTGSYPPYELAEAVLSPKPVQATCCQEHEARPGPLAAIVPSCSRS